MISVGFDFDHTLGIDNGLECKAVLALAADLGLHLDDDAVKPAIESLLHDFREGTTPLARSLPAFFAAHGLVNADGNIEVRWREHALALVDRLVEPLPGARELLRSLAERGIPVAVLTNGWSPLQEAKLAKIGYSGSILVSATIGRAKPDGRAFDLLARALNAPLAACWYIGDTPTVDVVGARDAGMHGVWFDWEGHPWPPGVSLPEARIERLPDFLELIPGSETAAENLR